MFHRLFMTTATQRQALVLLLLVASAFAALVAGLSGDASGRTAAAVMVGGPEGVGGRWSEVALVLVVSVTLMVTGMVSLVIAMARTRREEFLFFGLFCGTMAMLVMIQPSGENPLGLAPWLARHLGVASACVAVWAGIMVPAHWVGMQGHRAVKGVRALSLTLAALALLLPGQAAVHMVEMANFANALVGTVVGIWLYIVAIQKGVWEAKILLLAGLVLSAVAMGEAVEDLTGGVSTTHMEPVIVVYIVIFFSVLVIRHTALSDRYSTLVAHAPDGIVVLDEGGVEIEFNAAYGRIRGDVPSLRATLEEASQLDWDEHQRGARPRVELRQVGSGGRIRVFESLAVDLELQRRLFVLRDITARRSAEFSMREAARMEMLSTVVAGVAHDFNNALGALLGQAGLLRRHVQPPHDRHLGAMEKVIRQASSMTKRLMAMVRGGAQLRQRVDLGRLVRDTAELVEGTLSSKVRLEITVAEPAPVVIGSGSDLEQVVHNLLLNAVDSVLGSGSGGIWLDVEDLGEEGVLLTVEDDGKGIPLELRERVWEPFFSTKAKGKGTGIGLAVVARVVDQLGGRVSLESPQGGGARFVVWLPHAGEEGRKPSGRIEHVRRVLVVDDDPNVLEVMVAVLQGKGYQVESHDSAEAAYLAWRAQPSDALVTDVAMPGRSGVELARELEADHPGLPVVIVSGFVPDETQPIDPSWVFVSKPFTDARLAEALVEASGGEGTD